MITRLRECAVCVALVAIVSGCGPGPGEPQPLAPGDPELFATHVQPYLERRCATLDCHGVAGRPLRLYSELGLRLEPALRRTPISDRAEPTALTARELADNQLAIAAIALASHGAEQHLALSKPLALDAGGVAHEGGVHWPSKTDRGYLCLRGYLVGDRDSDSDTASACAAALDADAP